MGLTGAVVRVLAEDDNAGGVVGRPAERVENVGVWRVDVMRGSLRVDEPRELGKVRLVEFRAQGDGPVWRQVDSHRWRCP